MISKSEMKRLSTLKPEDIHVVPIFDGEPVHDEKPGCWCEPEKHYVNPYNGVTVWVHRRPE